MHPGAETNGDTERQQPRQRAAPRPETSPICSHSFQTRAIPRDFDTAAEFTGAGAAAGQVTGSGLELELGLGASPLAARNPILT